jgi:prepilin-type N-terminal cleavage/methylation domain-containing protein
MRSFQIKSRSMQRKGERGFSLIEIVISMLVLTVVFGGVLSLMMNFSVKNVLEQNRRTAAMAAKELMEEIKSKKFDTLSNQDPITGWSALGVDAGETAGTKSTFNDVDDYNGLSESLASPFVGFTRSTTVSYVSSAAINTATASRLNDYKKVTVSVSFGGTTYATLVTVVSSAVVPS